MKESRSRLGQRVEIKAVAGRRITERISADTCNVRRATIQFQFIALSFILFFYSILFLSNSYAGTIWHSYTPLM